MKRTSIYQKKKKSDAAEVLEKVIFLLAFKTSLQTIFLLLFLPELIFDSMSTETGQA